MTSVRFDMNCKHCFVRVAGMSPQTLCNYHNCFTQIILCNNRKSHGEIPLALGGGNQGDSEEEEEEAGVVFTLKDCQSRSARALI